MTNPQLTPEDYRLSRMRALHAMLTTIFDPRERGSRTSTPIEMLADMVIELAELSIAEQEQAQLERGRLS